jgi:hypothetical protein
MQRKKRRKLDVDYPVTNVRRCVSSLEPTRKVQQDYLMVGQGSEQAM